MAYHCEPISPGFNVIVERVFDRQDFDMWILRAGASSPFPDYLESFFHSRYFRSRRYIIQEATTIRSLTALADQLLAETDLEAARQQVFEMQAYVAEDLPYVALFDTPIVETFRSDKIEFPYTESWGGLQSAAGMPTLVNFK